jgi:hypothetical protein
MLDQLVKELNSAESDLGISRVDQLQRDFDSDFMSTGCVRQQFAGVSRPPNDVRGWLAGGRAVDSILSLTVIIYGPHFKVLGTTVVLHGSTPDLIQVLSVYI